MFNMIALQFICSYCYNRYQHMHKQYQTDPTLLNYLQTLQVQSKFKAKIIYTLACIHNYLQASTQSKYATNIFTICSAKGQLLALAQLHPDCTVLEPISSLFVKLQKSTVNPSLSRQFLNKILNLNIQTQLTTHFTENICALLYILQHLYPDTKKLCMKLLCIKNITKVQSKLLMDVINFQCKLNLKQICLIGQKGNVAVDDMLKTMWKVCSVGFNGNKDIQNTMKRYLNQRWWDQRLKYMCVAVFIANSTNQQGVIQELSPNFMSQFYKSNPKPFYIVHSPVPKFQDFSQIFPHIASYISSELLALDPITYPAFIKSLSSILPHQFATNSDYNQIIAAIFDNKQPVNNLQSKYCSLIPIEAICIKDNNPTDLYVKINKQITLGNGYYALQKLLTHIKAEVKKFTEIQWRLYLLILIISLQNKKHLYLREIQKIIHFAYQNSNIFHSLISNNLNNLTFLPILFYNQNSFKNYPKDKLDYIFKSIDKFMNNQEIKLQQKFYVVEKLIKMRYLPGVSKFVYFLLRKLPQQKVGFQEIAYYLKNGNWTQKDTQWVLQNFGEQLESILQKVFSQLAFSQFKAPRSIIFALQKYQVFQSWSQLYRWALNPLDQPNFDNPQALVDCFQVLQTVIENCKKVPTELIKKFFYIITKHWESYNHNHMFTIQRISNTLFSEQQFSSTDLQGLSSYLKSLPSSRSFSASNKQIYNVSLTLLISNTLLQQTQDIDIALTQQINSILSPGKIEAYLKSYEGTKDILFTLQTLMWKYQYQEEIIDDKIAEGLIKILNNFHKLQIPNEPDRYKIVQVALQVLSSVGHNCNLLDIGLLKILSSYIMNVRIIQISTQIIINVKQANLKAISKFKLQRLIPIFLSSLLINNSDQLTLAHLSLLEQLISSKQSSPYYSVFAKNSSPLIQILRSQAIFVSGKYAPQIVKFALEWAINLGILDRISKKWIQMLWIKYWYEQKIRIMCEKIIGNLGDKKIILQKIPKAAEQVIQNITKQDNLAESKLPKQTQKQEIQNNYMKENLKQNIQEPPNPKIQQQKSTKSIIQINKIEEKQEIQNIPQKISQKAPQKEQLVNQKKQNSLQMHIKQENQVLNTQQVTSPKINNLNLNIGTIQQKDVTNSPQHKPPTLHPKSQSPFPSDFGGAGTGSAKKKKSAQAVQREEQVQNINSIKNHVQYIGSLAGIEIKEDQYNKLKESFKYLTQVVQIHQYYCQKIVNFGIVSKCLALHLETQKKVIEDISELFQQISLRKQKNLLIFNDSNSINFFKNTLKNSLLVQKQLPTTSQIICIVKNCWSTSSQFFSAGLISMLLEMAKIPLNRVQILELLSSPNNELSYQIVNEIYQRGLLNVLENTIKMKIEQMNQNDKLQLILWGRLIGKVCVNGSIRQKLWSIGLHAKIWEKKKIFEQKGCQQNLAYFYGSFCYQFEKLALWCIQQKIPQYLFTTLQSYQNLTPIEFYKFFRYFSQNGNQFVQHLFRIQLHTYLISILPILKAKLKNQGVKHYYKCFAHMFTPQRYQIFIKAQLIKKLVKKYKDQHSSYILECLQKLIVQIRQKKQLDVLQKQDFYTINTQNCQYLSVFNSKIKDDLSYPYILQTYITLLKKFKKFETRYLNLDLVHQIIRKAIYSINMQGKKKTIQFLIQFSQIDKVYYGNANVMVLLQSLLSYNTGQQQLQLTCTYLSIEAKYKKPARASQQLKTQQQQKYPMRFKNVVSIPCDDLLNTLLSKFLQLKQQGQTNESLSKNNSKSLRKILQILQYFKNNESNSINIFSKIGTLLVKSNDKVIKYDDSLTLINQLLSWKAIQNRFESLGDTLLNYLKSVAQYLGQHLEKKSQVFEQYAKLLQRCLKTNVIAELQFQKFCRQFLKNHKIASTQPIKRFLKLCLDYKSNEQITSTMKNIMRNGIHVKLYKPDGSNSSLLLFFTDDLFEIHCANSLTQPVKSKWKMGVVEITDILVYQTQADYKNSIFYLSEGLFTKAPPIQNCLTLQSHSKNLYICFDTNIQLKQWKKYIEMAKNQAHLILLKVSQSYI